MTTEQRWATAVRVLALLSVFLGTVAVLEAVTVRRARAELQQLRQEREDAKAARTGTWARESATEVGEAIAALDGFYDDSAEGFGRPGGLCAGGHLNVEPIVTYVLGAYLPTRALGRSNVAAADAMKAAVRATADYRAIHQSLAPAGR